MLVGPVAVLGRTVDRSGETQTSCEAAQGPIRTAQNKPPSATPGT